MKFSAGSMESSDCYIQIEDANETTITIESIVYEQFGEQIYDVIKATLEEQKASTIKVTCFDKGALDYTIKARLLTALERKENYHE